MEGIGDSTVSEGAWSSFRPYQGFKDTLPLTGISDTINDNASETSDIPVLTQEQEVQMRNERKRKRSSKKNDDKERDSLPLASSMELDDGQAFLDNWNPGFDIHEKTEDHKKRVSWPVQDQLASTLRTTTASIDNDVRDLGESIQDGDDPGEFRKLGDRPRSFEQSMEVIPEDIRKQTPRATGFSSKLMIGTGGENVKSYDFSNLQGGMRDTDITERKLPFGNEGLSQTMRDGLRQLSREQHITQAHSIEQTEERLEDRLEDAKRKAEDEDKEIPQCWWRSVIFVLVIGLVVAAIIALSVTLKADKKHANSTAFIVPNPVIKKECPSITVKLGQTIIFECEFVEGHEARGTIENTESVTVQPPNRVSIESFRVERVSYQFTITGPEATCSSLGRYTLTFKNGIETVYSVEVFLNIEAGLVTTSLKQNSLETFLAECTIVKDCMNEDLSFRGSQNNTLLSLDGEKQCNSTYSDSDGYTTTCSTRFSSDKTELTSMYPACTWSGNKQTLQLPSCIPSSDCRHSCSSYQDTDCTDVDSCFPHLRVYKATSSACTLELCRHNSTNMAEMTVKEALCLESQSGAATSTTPLP